jgi:hypothetical protein
MYSRTTRHLIAAVPLVPPHWYTNGWLLDVQKWSYLPPLSQSLLLGRFAFDLVFSHPLDELLFSHQYNYDFVLVLLTSSGTLVLYQDDNCCYEKKIGNIQDERSSNGHHQDNKNLTARESSNNRSGMNRTGARAKERLRQRGPYAMTLQGEAGANQTGQLEQTLLH